MMKLLGKSKEEKINAPVGSAEYGRLVKEAYIDNTINEAKFLSDDLYDSISRHDEIIDAISKLKVEKDIIEHTIMGLMKENEIAYIKERKITWKKTSRVSFDTKLFKLEEPELYEKYCRVSNNRLFKIK
ncbi:MAG: hypothetical protein E7E21_08780 [Peptostreptococcaceae bacterium]|nr:hypothetical protein [Peptostreptococcaceae bacterium]